MTVELSDIKRIQSASVKTYSAAFPNGNANAAFVESDTVPQGYHWICLSMLAVFRQTTGFTSGNFPNSNVSGIWLCPENTPSPIGELLNGAGAGLLQTQCRPIEVDDKGHTFNTAASTDRWTYYVLDPTSKLYIPGGWFVQAIANNPLVAGFAGIWSLTMQVIIEEDC